MEDEESDWEPELLESQLLGHDPEDQGFQIQLPVEPAKRGPKKLPVMWSRVISISEDEDEDIGVFNIEYALLELLDLPRPLPPRREAEWAPIFQPQAYSKEHEDIYMAGYAIGEKRLRILGIVFSKLREELRKDALHQSRKEA